MPATFGRRERTYHRRIHKMNPDYQVRYQFQAEVWQHQGVGGWHFISMPIKLAQEIRTHFKSQEKGWGRLQARSLVGGSEWKTAIWFDTKHNTYLLPIKADIRKKEGIKAEDSIQVSIWV